MISDDVLVEHEYINVNTKKKYKVIAVGWALVNENNKRNWRAAVTYVPVEESESVYTRTVENFKANFEEINNIVEL